MDLEGSELTALEEQLYSSIHHTFDESANQDGDMQWPQSFAGATSTPSRVVSNTSVVNNNFQPRASKMKRYWAPNTPQQPNVSRPVLPSHRNQTEARVFPKSVTHPSQSMAANQRPQTGTQLTSTEQSTGEPKRSLIAPYQSLLANWDLQRNPGGSGSLESTPAPNAAQSPGTKEKKRKKKQPPKHPVEKRLASLVSLVQGGEEKEVAKERFQAKKSKATAVRNKLADKVGPKLRVVAEISLDSSDDETKQPSRPAKLKPSSVPPSDDDTTDVELIPAPPPPKICIDCSDDEAAQDSFVLPKSKRTKKKKTPKNASSPRCLSPSNSSIMSDDFIGHNDRSRLNDSFAESIPNDDELETECLRRESVQASRKSRSTAKERNKRAPSVSSDGTIGTASDATDQDRRTSEGTSGDKTSKEVLLFTTGQSDGIPGDNAQLGKPPQNGEEMVLKSKSKSKKSAAVAAAAASTVVRSKSHSPASHGSVAQDQMMEDNNATVNAATVEQHAGPKGKAKSKNKTNQSLSAEGTDTAAPSNKAGKAATKSSLRSKHDTESESMYHEISKISTKSKNDTVCYDDSSISSESDYNITLVSNKSPATPTESRKVGAGNEAPISSTVLDRMDDVSSESDIEEFLQRSSKEPTVSMKKRTVESAKASKKKSTGAKRRKKYNSENLSDEEFASMLTDIVQAVSDGDDDDEDDDLEFEDQDIEQPNQATDQNAAVSAVTEASPQPSPDQQQPAPEEKGKKKKRRKVAATSGNATTVTLSDTDDDILEISDVSNVKDVVDDSASLPNATLLAAGRSCRPGWNKEMELFYNCSKTESQFSMRRVMDDMPRDADQWKIIDKDRYPDPPKRGKPCHNCGEQGHMRYKCQNAPKPLVCRICGKQGHHEPRCPMTICLNCGNRTRSFVYDCSNCRSHLRKKCHICGIIGHSATMCPDNWRRYHSTTEDNVPLVQKFKRNNIVKQCSICGRTNHQTQNCYVAARIFSCPIPSENVHSYKPIYPYVIGARKSCPPEAGSRPKQSHVQTEQQESAVSSGNCEVNSCELNLGALIETPNGFYHRFVQTMGLLQEQPNQGEQVVVTGTKDSETEDQQQPRGLRVFQRNKKPKNEDHSSSIVVVPTASDQQSETPCHVKEEPDTVLESEPPTETRDDDATVVVALPEASITEDSNYSFSELLQANGEEQLSTLPIKLSPQPKSEGASQPNEELDFIPLNGLGEQGDCNVNQAKSQDDSPEKAQAELAIIDQSTSNAKICLSKENAKLLLSLPGQEFLQLARVKHEVTLMITFELVGNVLHVAGTAAHQDAFRAELVQFLKEQELAAYNKKLIIISSVPKKSRRAARHITLFFEQLLKPFGSVKDIFNRYINAQKSGLQLQACEKARRTLNMVLFGVYGMREGRSRMNQLIRQVAELKQKQPKEEVDPSLRQTINEHMVYIFSSYDHGDYKEIFNEFQRLNQLQQIKKFTWMELGLPDPIFSDISLYPMVQDDEADTKANDFASQFVEIVNPQKTREYNEKLMQRHKVPRFANKVAFHITIHFKKLLRSFDSVKNMFQRYVCLQQEVIQSKEVENARTQLNMVLFGVYGMREGRKRMNQLIQAAGTYRKSTEPVDPCALNTVNENLAYIFSSYDHGNYTKILAEYQQLRKQQRLNKITAKDMGLKGRIALTATNIKQADDLDATQGSNQEAEDEEQEEEEEDCGGGIDEEVEQQQELQQPSNPNNDHDSTKESLILNTYDQMIDPQRLEWLDRASRNHDDEEDYQMQLQLPQLVENILFSNCSFAPAQRQQQRHYQQQQRHYQQQPQHYHQDHFASIRTPSNGSGYDRAYHRDDHHRSSSFIQQNSRRLCPTKFTTGKLREIMAEQEEKVLRCLRLAHCNKGMRYLTDRIDIISKRAKKGPLRPMDRMELDKILHTLSNKRQSIQTANRGRRGNARYTPNYRHSY